MGWTVALRENAQVAKHLIQTCCEVTRRQQVLAQARNVHPVGFRCPPAPRPLIREVWINRPEPGVVLVG